MREDFVASLGRLLGHDCSLRKLVVPFPCRGDVWIIVGSIFTVCPKFGKIFDATT